MADGQRNPVAPDGITGGVKHLLGDLGDELLQRASQRIGKGSGQRNNKSNKKKFFLCGLGAAIASRLSEVRGWKILLLEAGGDEPEIISNAPALAAYLQLSTIDWGFKSEPMPTACLGLTGGRCVNWFFNTHILSCTIKSFSHHLL